VQYIVFATSVIQYDINTALLNVSSVHSLNSHIRFEVPIEIVFLDVTPCTVI